MFGDVALAFYKLYCLPIQLMIYSWGISVMTPVTEKRGGSWRRLLNAPTIAMLLGMAVGLSGAGKYIPGFVTNSLDTLKVCMGPVAMLLAGVTIAKYDFLSMLKNKKVYVATFLRLFPLPAIIVSFTFLLKTLANSAFGINIGNDAMVALLESIGLRTVKEHDHFAASEEVEFAIPSWRWDLTMEADLVEEVAK